MSNHPLIAAMEAEVAVKAAAIQRQADDAVAAIATAADQALAAHRAQHEVQLQQQLQRYERQARWRADNGWRARCRSRQSEVAEQILTELAQAVAAAPRCADYPAIWTRLFEEALAVYRQHASAPPILRVAAADRTLAEQRAGDVAAIDVAPSLDGGVELLSPDRRLRVNNGLASRWHRGREEFRKTILDALQKRMPP